MYKRSLILGMLLLISMISYSQKSERKEKMDEKLQSQKIAYITSELELSPEESQVFWPIYNEHETEINKLKEGMKRVKPSSEMTEEAAAELVSQSLEFEEKALQLKKSYLNKMAEVLPMTKIAKLQMLEREFKRKMLRKIRDRYNDKKGLTKIEIKEIKLA